MINLIVKTRLDFVTAKMNCAVKILVSIYPSEIFQNYEIKQILQIFLLTQINKPNKWQQG